MITVQWDDWEGNRHQRTFDRLEDAKLEAETLKEKFDFVEISDGQATGWKGVRT